MFKFIDYPMRFTIEDYQNTIDYLKNKLQNCSEILKSVYVKDPFFNLQPGISDIDFGLVVNKDSIKEIKSILNIFEKVKVTQNKKYGASVIIHSPFLYLKSWGSYLFRYEVQPFFPESKFRLICGEEFFEEKYGSILTAEIRLNLLRMNQIRNILRLLAFFHYSLKYKQIRIRRILGYLKNLQISLKYLKIPLTTRQMEYNKRVQNLRQNWFTKDASPKLRELLSLLKEAICLIYELLDIVPNLFSHKKIEITSQLKRIKLPATKQIHSFFLGKTYFLSNVYYANTFWFFQDNKSLLNARKFNKRWNPIPYQIFLTKKILPVFLFLLFPYEDIDQLLSNHFIDLKRRFFLVRDSKLELFTDIPKTIYRSLKWFHVFFRFQYNLNPLADSLWIQTMTKLANITSGRLKN